MDTEYLDFNFTVKVKVKVLHLDYEQHVRDDFSQTFAILNIIHHALVHNHKSEDQQYLNLDMIDQHKDLPLQLDDHLFM